MYSQNEEHFLKNMVQRNENMAGEHPQDRSGAIIGGGESIYLCFVLNIMYIHIFPVLSIQRVKPTPYWECL